MMKHKETVDDEAIKIESKIQRSSKKDDFPEMEDPAGYNHHKEINSAVIGKPGQKKKKEMREDRAKNARLIRGFANGDG